MTALVLLAFSSLGWAAAPVQDPVDAARAAWDARTGRSWILETSRATGGLGRFLWGAQAEAAFTPETDADWFDLALQSFDAASGMFGVATDTLVPVAVQRLDLAVIGSSDKVAVEFMQRIGGVRVAQASAHALFTPQGALLALDADAVAGVPRLQVRPVAGRWEAAAAARAWFAAQEGMEGAVTAEPELVVVRHAIADSDLLEPRLAWAVEVRNESNPAHPAARRVYVAAADRSGEVLAADALIHQQIQGHVESWATPGSRAGSASNPPTIQAMRYLTLTSASGNATTDVNGDFTAPSASPVTFTARYSGPYARVENQAGANYSLSQSFTPGVPSTMTMNPAKTEFTTSEASCFDSVIDVRAWLKNARPTDTAVDFQVLANANINSACNAYYNGSSINMYRAGGGCNNTGYSTVVAHEEGHWMNDIYGSGNGFDGFGEGNADVVGMYVYDTPIIGEDFYSGGGYIRTGLNTRQFCGDTRPGCYGEVHNDGEVLMGALWKVRDNLNVALGGAAGDLTADVLWASWMNAYNDGLIKTVIESHWLVLDDNDGNILNGTPNYGSIDAGFRAQGFPGIDIDTISIVHTPLTDTLDENGPYVVDATITSLVGSVITAAEVVYSVSGGAAQTVAMSNLGGGLWRGQNPGQPSPAIVNYHLAAHDANSNDEREPVLGEWEFKVGVYTELSFNDFEGATDEGWVHGALSGTDDWERNKPLGASTDPNAAYSGLKCWGNDLGTGGTNGNYPSNSNNYLTSPLIDCSGRTGVKLRFARCLNVNAAPQDEARLEVNGTTFFVSPTGSAFNEGGWTVVEYDISSVADNNPAVQITFRLKSDVLGFSGGWNLDDVLVYTLEPVPGGGNTIVLTGPTSVPAGGSQLWSFSAAPPSSPYWLLNGANAGGTVFSGHVFDVGGTITVLASGTSSAAGTGSASIFVPAGASGHTGFFEVAARSGGAWYDSNLLTVTVQ